jgi:F0F1-type ATP synthase assembly protein I
LNRRGEVATLRAAEPGGRLGKQTQRGDASRAYSLGFELVCAVAGFVLVGIWIDRHYSSGPWGVLTCLFLGLIGGFYNLYRGASRLFNQRGTGAARGAPLAPTEQPGGHQPAAVDGTDRPHDRLP